MDILIVNSDPEMAKQLRALLEGLGHRVHTSAGVSEALPLLEARSVDLVVAECHQLEMSGAALFASLERWPQPPLIVPTTPQLALGGSAAMPSAEVERVRAIVAQAQRLLNRREGEVLQVGDLVVDQVTKRVLLHGRLVQLPPIQFRLLAYLAENAGRVVAAQELLKAVWGYEGDETEARELVKVHVRQIRRRLGLEAQRADYVQSVRGFGYMVSAPTQG